MRYRRLISGLAMVCSMALLTPVVQADATLESALAVLQKVGPEGKGHQQAVEVWSTVASSNANQLTKILSSMDDSNPLADNWVRGAVDAIAERTLASGLALPAAELEAYVSDQSHSGRSRRLAFEWLVKADETAQERWATKLLEDTSLELRREAVAKKLADGAAADKVPNKEAAVAAYQVALQHARDLDQIDEATEALRKLGADVDLPAHFGFITKWHLIGPFDNTERSGFDKVYPPEQDVKLDEEYPGKGLVVRWEEHATEDDYGLLNLNDLLGKHKGSLAYAVAFFDATDARDVELRLGCINANKIWLNGELLTANHVYHSGRGIDQYVGKGKLKAGRNVILLKICQNEQEESWAQDWQYQLRVCDAIGTAVTSQ